MSSRTLLATAWTIAVLALCLAPSSWLPVAEAPFSPTLFLVPRDKMVHFGLFAILSVLWMRVMPTRGWTARVGVAGLALAVLTELGQGLPMIRRDPDTFDILADAVGMFAGLGGYWALRGLIVAAVPRVPERVSPPEY